MPLACMRCGAPNPDANRFCQSCGQPLAASAAVATAAPPGYQSPYYVAVGEQPVHRLPWLTVIAIVAGLVLVLGCFGAALAFVRPHTNAAGSVSGFGNPAPPSAVSAGPTTEADPAPVETVTISSLSVTVPSGFSVEDKSDVQVTVSTPDGEGLIQVESQRMSVAATAQQLQQQAFGDLKQKYPDAKLCASQDNVEVNGPVGSMQKICFTATEQGASALSVAAVVWIATNAAHNVMYEVDGLTVADSYDGFIDMTSPLVNSVSWKLS
jgi:hypothetical protein